MFSQEFGFQPIDESQLHKKEREQYIRRFRERGDTYPTPSKNKSVAAADKSRSALPLLPENFGYDDLILIGLIILLITDNTKKDYLLIGFLFFLLISD